MEMMGCYVCNFSAYERGVICTIHHNDVIEYLNCMKYFLLNCIVIL